jgi:nucleoside-diphosphate-sugar epimerase
VRTIDRRDGVDLTDRVALRPLLAGAEVIVHLAALHPLVAPPDAADSTYHSANVLPFVALLEVARAVGVRRVVLASSTSVWRDAPPGAPARFLDEAVAPDADDGYARSKRECERLLHESSLEAVVLRLARFAKAGDQEDEVRKLYRAVDPRDCASAFVRAIEARPGETYAIAAPTPFRPEDAALLARDPRAAILARTGREPAWAPERIGSVVISTRAERELGWRAAYPSALLHGTG